MKEYVVKLLAKELKMSAKKLEFLIETPPKLHLGDFSFPCFMIAKKKGQNPLEVAKDLSEKLRKKLPKEITNIASTGGYLNFFVDKKVLAKKVLKEVVKKHFGENTSGKGKTVVFDMSSPNIAKPFGIGHLRSTIIGNAIAQIAKANGYKTVKINYLGDWGTQFGKMIFGFRKWGDEKKLSSNPTKHLLEIYVKANDERYENDARREFKKLEDGDVENMRLWKQFRDLSIKEFDKVYDLLGVSFDVVDGESNYNAKMGAVVADLKKKKLLVPDDGAQIVDLSSDNLGVALIKKSDGASLYITRDLAVALHRKKKYKFDTAIYEVGAEQKLHFKQLFATLDKMGYSWAKDCVHVAHGLYLGADGKKLATRAGKTIFMMDILDEVIAKARKNLADREHLSDKELDRRSKKIALAAVLYGDLKNSRENNMVFDADRFISFEGDTGPYLLYSYARANSISRKVKSDKPVKIVDLKDEEIVLLKLIDSFPEVVRKAYTSLAPNIIANYSFELAQAFNEFYHSCPVRGSIEEGFRLKLVEAFRTTIKKALDLLGIDVLEEM